MNINPEHLTALTSKITPIGIEDLSCLEEYKITVSDGDATHTIRFIDGGHAEITFHSDGTAHMNSDRMLVKRFKEGGTLLCALSDMDVDGMKDHIL
jgi:hypothetical protein